MTNPNMPTPGDVAARTTTHTRTAQAPQAAEPDTQHAANNQQETRYTPPATQDDLDRIIEARLARERAKYAGYDELKAKAKKYDEAEDAKKNVEQRAQVSTRRCVRCESGASISAHVNRITFTGCKLALSAP
ncbi:hypothetical protein ACUY3K_07265 [Corynebacterium uberis]|uniref:hypothetical protein n=1 Tax=Corynebacterium uberis TaxID=2883169 RepID=UPI001D0AAC8A|nr:hypothetical protein [Corynebacterium uberis]UDL74636.1 hypothetical protein LH391_05465 [Corynebacterium uberis]UDL76530.1 hypothetical protein LH393_03940 [Corynebacterium uberis]UDL78742.1 hypothetical protein LH394_03925 [Corynebacterium uberis]UDL81021.1 hypothetical protein LH392_04350 [Corynebacterium uberis]UDL85366.1 hypothetical protein LH390_03930 [Corynebacterium uberis]